MSKIANAPDKTKPRKPAPAPRKREPEPSAPATKQLRVRYNTVMKPWNVYALTVEVANPRVGDVIDQEGVVVVRPIVPGAQVTPPEQRLDVGHVGNEITFHVTPLAKGRLPRARLEVFVPEHPPQELPLPMKAKTQRLAWTLLVLAFLLPWLTYMVTVGDWKMREEIVAFRKVGAATQRTKVMAEHGDVLAYKINSIFTSEEPGGIVNAVATGIGSVYDWLNIGYRELRLGIVIWGLFLLLALVAYFFNRPRGEKRSLSLPKFSAIVPESEPMPIVPLGATH